MSDCKCSVTIQAFFIYIWKMGNSLLNWEELLLFEAKKPIPF